VKSRRFISGLLVSTLALGWMGLPSTALACAACFGKSDDALARGMNAGIFALLFVIGSVLVGIAAFAIFLARRAARMPLVPASIQAAEPLAAPAAQPSKIVTLHG
jgi:hypothetical protein